MEKGNVGKNIYKDWTVRDANMLSPLQLAYIGDAVYEVFIRRYLLEDKSLPVNELHKKAIEFVKAKAQSDIVHDLMDVLSEEELRVVKRGRNTKSGTVPKNANVSDYRYATGFEALIGYLFILDREDRIKELFSKIIKR